MSFVGQDECVSYGLGRHSGGRVVRIEPVRVLPPQRPACLLLLSKHSFKAYILRNAFFDHLD